jgi:hypothetical protein
MEDTNSVVTISKKDLPRIKDIALRIINEHYYVNRDIVMFQALEEYLKISGVNPSFRIKWDRTDYVND